MRTRNRVVNNQDSIANQISRMFRVSIAEAVADDGSVIVRCHGNLNQAIMVARRIMSEIGCVDIGDGVQDGNIWIVNEDRNIHAEVDTVANMDFIPN